VSQDAAASKRSRVLAHPERPALAAARAAAAARSELVHKVHPVGLARLAERGPEALPLDRLLELEVPALLEVADRDYRVLARRTAS
jgi:hypothetical protein